MRCLSAVLAVCLIGLAPLAARADEGQGYPSIVGDSVDPHNRAHWPVRVRSFDRIDWAYRGGKMPGMMTPDRLGGLRLMAGAGHLRAVDIETGKHAR